MKCDTCTEPTKRLVGFWDGYDDQSNPIHGYTFTCECTTCPGCQVNRMRETDLDKRRSKTHFTNKANGINVKKLKRLRIKANCSIMDISKTLNCSPAQYSAYETEKDPFPPRLWELLIKYLTKFLPEQLTERKKENL